jgi:precorrin-3B methylase
MTPISRAVRRVSLIPHRGRLLVVGLGPGDIITLRPKGRRAEETVSLGWLYDQAVIRRVQYEKAQKAAARKAKREGKA